MKEEILKFFIVYQCELHFQNDGSVVSVQRNYRRIFGNETSPSKCTKPLVLKFKETVKTEDKPRSGRPRSIRTDASIQRVAASVADNPKTSTRRRCFHLGNDPLLTAKYPGKRFKVSSVQNSNNTRVPAHKLPKLVGFCELTFAERRK